MLNAFFTLTMRTVTEPKDVARELLALKLERGVLWIALALAVILNTIAFQISLVLTPPQGDLPILFTSPVIFAVLIGAGLVLSVFSVTYAGRMLGGKAKLEGMMTLLVWLQFLRFAVQLASFILMLVLPGLGAMLVFAASLYGLWLLVQFIDVAQEFDNLFTSFAAMLLAGLGVMLGLAIVLSLLGVQNMGLTPYV